MRSLVLASLFISATALAGSHPPDPPLTQVLAQAAKEHKPVLLDFWAIWCQPCAALERDVFPKPEVQAALKGYVFQHYDAEVGEGSDLAERFKVRGYPTLLVLSPSGEVLSTINDFTPAGMAAQLTALSGGGGAAKPKVVDPNDPDAIFTKLREDTRTNEARAHGELLVGFVEKYPAAPASLQALASIAAFPEAQRPSPARLGAAADKVIDALVLAKDTGSLNELVYGLIGINLNDKALRAAQALEPLVASNGGMLDTVAEAYFQAGQQAKAVEIETRVVGLLPKDPGVAANLERFKSGKVGFTGGRPMMDPLSATYGGAPTPAQLERRNAVARMEHAIADKCRADVGEEHGLYVRLYVKNGAVMRAVLLDDEAPKKRHACVEGALKGIVLSPQIANRDVLTLKTPARLAPK